MRESQVLDPIAELRSSDGALLSMYLERPSPGGFSALISALGRDLAMKAQQRSRVVEKSVALDIARIRRLADDLELEPVPAYAIFASNLDSIFEIKALAHGAPSIATIGSRPYLRPLRSIPRPIRSAFLIADRSQARLFIGYDGAVDRVGDPLVADVGKPNYGGFGGYDEHNVRERAQQLAKALWRRAGDILLEQHKKSPFELLIVGCQAELVEDIRSEIHPYLRQLDRAHIPVGPVEATLGRLRAELADQRSQYRHRREEALVDRLFEAAASGGNAVLGLPATLRAVNAQAVSDLVVAGDFTRSGALCPRCGFLARLADQCSVCGAGMHEVDDVVGAAMDATVANGGSAWQLMIGSRLDSRGIGALTRFPVPE